MTCEHCGRGQDRLVSGACCVLASQAAALERSDAQDCAGPCPNCKGVGKGYSLQPHGERLFEVCDECGGSGVREPDEPEESADKRRHIRVVIGGVEHVWSLDEAIAVRTRITMAIDQADSEARRWLAKHGTMRCGGERNDPAWMTRRQDGWAGHCLGCQDCSP